MLLKPYKMCNSFYCATTNRVEQAYIPELGLSNKGKETMTAQEKKEQVREFTSYNLSLIVNSHFNRNHVV